MKLTHVRIEQFKQFRQVLDIDGLQDGVNLFTGPNEAGKSTVVAAIRAAFFERYRSSAAEEFRPWDIPSASPRITLAFEHDGVDYRLIKRFLAGKRCELHIGSRILDGAEAEDHLAALMGFQHPGKGASKADHWGIPGLLWIQQGSGQEVRESVHHATTHLRTALNEPVGEVASTHGDDILREVQAARDGLLTGATGKPRGAYAAALEKTTELESQRSALRAEIVEYRHKVDSLETLRREHATDTAAPPWAAFREQEKAAQEKLREIQGWQDALALERAQLGQWESRVDLLTGRRDAFAAEERAAAGRQQALERALQAQQEAATLVRPWQERVARTEAALATARALLQEARQTEARQRLARERDTLSGSVRALADTLARAEQEQAELIAHQREAAGKRIDAKDVKRLREVDRALQDLQLRQAGAATRLRFLLDPDRHVEIDGERVQGSGEKLVAAPTSVALPGLGRLEIAPGGTDLAAMRRERESLETRRDALLQAMHVTSLDVAEGTEREYAAHLSAAGNAEATLKGLAPRGIAAMRAELNDMQARLAGLDASMSTAGGPSAVAASRLAGPPAVLGVDEAESAATMAEQSLAQATRGLHGAELAASQAQVHAQAARAESESAQAALQAAGREERRTAAQRDLANAISQRDATQVRADTLARQVAQARPDILEQDVQRFRKSAEQHERRHVERQERLVRLEVELEAAGARGLEERCAELDRDLSQAQRQAQELRRRARALDYLLNLLREKRNALVQRLQAPLKRAMQHYVDLLFSDAQLEIADDLTLEALTRAGSAGAERMSFRALSFGAREQIGLIARLAYADLLRQAGRPTLVILDDALVHSDNARLAQMKRILFDAASRHQVLLFTCHPETWRDIGAAPRNLGE